jgi:hypothetical protein
MNFSNWRPCGTGLMRTGVGDEMRDVAYGSGLALPTRAAIATMHGKERALAPHFLAIGIELVLPSSLDTDRFGTFTRDRPRAGTMLETARAKAQAAMLETGLHAALASEGAYGPHPTIPLLAVGREMLLFIDAAQGFEVVEMMIDERPSFGHCSTASVAEVEAFLNEIGFPEQGVIVAPVGRLNEPVAKGIRALRDLEPAICKAIELSPRGKAHVETDMRALMNPRRMEFIGEVGRQMMARLSTRCPDCDFPGWGKVRSDYGLPCSLCGCPTSLPRHDVFGCVSCGVEERHERSPGALADPTYCSLCNP